MSTQAQGTFAVRLAPQPLHEQATGSTLGRLSIDKQFTGDLEATSVGEMLSSRTATEGSAGYVAIEQVTGTLHGLSGSFVLQHTGIMARGVPQLSIVVIPDSGTGELAGLSGNMMIDVAAQLHAYTFDYSLAERV